jgi:HAD superfamily hydrolase (TIGR01509 family)
MDIGDVLIRTTPMRQYAEFERITNVSAAEAARSLEDSDLVVAYETGRLDTRGFVEAACRTMGVRPLPVGLFSQAWNVVIGDVEPVLVEAAARLARCGKLVLASNANPMHWAEVRRRLAEAGVTAPALLSFRAGDRKPGLPFFQALADLDARVPTRALFIDDRDDNVEAASGFGMTAFHHRDVTSTIAFLERNLPGLW